MLLGQLTKQSNAVNKTFICGLCKLIKYLSTGKCVVIGLQSTGEARTLEQLERDDGELTDFVSTAKGNMKIFLIDLVVTIHL